MPVTDPLQGATFLPAWPDPYQVPQTLQDMYQFLLARGVPRFTTTAERDAAYPSPVPGQMAFAAGALYMYSTSAATWRIIWRPDMPAQAEALSTPFQAISSTTFADLPNPVTASLVLPGPCVVRMDLQAITGVGGGTTTDLAVLGLAATGAGVSLTPAASGFEGVIRGQNFPILSGFVSQTVTTTTPGTLTAEVQGLRTGAAATVRGVRLTLTPLRWV